MKKLFGVCPLKNCTKFDVPKKKAVIYVILKLDCQTTSIRPKLNITK